MNACEFYWSMAACVMCFVLGCFAASRKQANWRHVVAAMAAGALWPGTLLAGWFIEQFERESRKKS